MVTQMVTGYPGQRTGHGSGRPGPGTYGGVQRWSRRGGSAGAGGEPAPEPDVCRGRGWGRGGRGGGDGICNGGGAGTY